MIEPLKENEYRCAACGGVYEYVNDDEWSDEKAKEELKEKFPGESIENCDIVCDDCFKKMGL